MLNEVKHHCTVINADPSFGKDDKMPIEGCHAERSEASLYHQKRRYFLRKGLQNRLYFTPTGF